MSNADTLKMERDGQLTYGKRQKWRGGGVIVSNSWLIERDEYGVPVRLHWFDRVPDQPDPVIDNVIASYFKAAHG